MSKYVAIVQGIYFIATGVWPLISLDTFQKVTGPKRDIWLVKTVGVVISVIGAAVLMAGVHGEYTPAIILLAVVSALGLALIDIFYVMKRVIDPIYLGDALIETVLIAWWAAKLAQLAEL